jgi:hypothetical protein
MEKTRRACAGRPRLDNQPRLRSLRDDEAADLAFFVLLRLSAPPAADLPFLPRWLSADAATDFPLIDAEVDTLRAAELTTDARRSFDTDGWTTRPALAALDITRFVIPQV